MLSVVGGERRVQEVCEEHEVSQTTYYEWRAATLHGAMRALDEQTNSADADAAR